MKLSIKINQKSIDEKINKVLQSDKIAKKVYDYVYNRYYRIRLNFFRDFDNHPVTLELNAGPKAADITAALSGYGNLFSFIGFKYGTRPAFDLRNFLFNSIRFNKTVYKNRHYYFKISIPTTKEIEDVTPLPWENADGSWVTAIEEGLNNAPQFIFKKWTDGRSKVAFQLPNDIENNEDLIQKPVKYTSQLFNDFREKINTIR